MAPGAQTWSVMVSAGAPPLVWTHDPLAEVPEGHVNVHGHRHGAPPGRSPHINVAVEQTKIRSHSVRFQIRSKSVVSGNFLRLLTQGREWRAGSGRGREGKHDVRGRLRRLRTAHRRGTPSPSSRDTRTLCRLELPAHLCDTGDAALRRALYVDCETTGLSVEHDQAVELAMLPFTYSVADGRIAEALHHEAQVHLHDPGRPLDPHEPDTANSEFFDREGCALLRDVLAFVLMLLDADAPCVSQWLGRDHPDAEKASGAGAGASESSENIKRFEAVIVRKGPPRATPPDAGAWVRALHARAQGCDGARGLNVVALAAWALSTPLVQSHDEDAPWLWEQLAKAALPAFGAEPGEARDVLERVTGYWRQSADVERQHMGVLASARGATHEFAAASVERTLYFGCEPGLSAPGAGVDFARLVACAAPDHSAPRFLLYQPARDGRDAVVAAALKARFFESVFADEDRQTARPDLALVGYVADEAHRKRCERTTLVFSLTPGRSSRAGVRGYAIAGGRRRSSPACA